MSSSDANSQNPVKLYTAQWKSVDALIQKRLPASALTEVKKIYALAKQEKQEAQLIKAAIYLVGLQAENREENETIAITEIEKELKPSTGAVKAILNSLLAEMYWQYYESNRYQLLDRTDVTEAATGTDITKWSADQLYRKISGLYLASVSDTRLLQQAKIEPFDALVTKGNMRGLRPTLFDLLAYRAIDYFRNDEHDIAAPAYKFEIATAAAMNPASDFIHSKFETTDSTSLQHKALLLYQQLIAFHINDANPAALIDADLARLAFVREASVHPDKEEQYFNAINHIAHQYEDTPAASQAWFLVASWYEQEAAEYNPSGDTTGRFSRIKAKAILDRLAAQKDSSEGKINALNLLVEINKPTLSFTVEKVNVPGQPFRTLVNYKNVGKTYLRLVRADAAAVASMRDQYNEKFWPNLLALPALKNWEQALPQTNDLQAHNVEIAVDALPAGTYILFAGNSSNYASMSTILGARLVYVSNISFVNADDDYFVLNRDNGQPMPGATVQQWQEKYDYKTSRNVRAKGAFYKTDEHGFFRLQRPSADDGYNRNNFLLEVKFGQEQLFIDESISKYYYRDGTENTMQLPSIFTFTDRGLYRPGQTVFFKSIILQKTGRTAEVLRNFKSVVKLLDVNSQVVDSLTLTTNEFGSVSGKFTLPSGGITGNYRLQVNDQSPKYFQVEEYKRPKFEVGYEPLKGTYKVNDKIAVTGTAKAYAGNNIDGASVAWRVVRSPRYIYPWLFKRWYPQTAPQEIAHGEVKTDADGKFVINFEAIPDLKIDRKLDPSFDYNIYADVTDINGETRSGETMVSVSYKSILLNVSIPTSLAADSLKSLPIRTVNNNGEFQPTTVHVTITKLKEEQRLIRSRFWERPDQHVMTKEEYVKLFPYDEYDSETDQSTWEKGMKFFEKTDSVRLSEPFSLDDKKFDAGSYVIEIVTNDKEGQEVKDVKYIELNFPKSAVAPNTYLWSSAGISAEPGEKASVKIGSAAGNVFLVQQLQRQAADLKIARIDTTYSFSQLDSNMRNIEFPVSETDRGGFGANWMFVKNNRVYTLSKTFSVSWDNKSLKIEYATFRDKTLPGSEEKWKLKISGMKNDAVAAEVLASMYDASLDQFSAFGWSRPDVWDWFYGRSSFSGSYDFATANSTERPLNNDEWHALIKDYDELSLETIFEGLNNGYGGGRGILRKLSSPMMAKSSADEVSVSGFARSAAPAAPMGDFNESEKKKDAEAPVPGLPAMIIAPEQGNSDAPPSPTPRRNFNETAFFFPDLRTDADGNIEFSFTMPEALTRWKFQALAHTKDLAFGSTSKEIITQKDLMVQPNPTRFLRQGDKMSFSAKVVNLSDKELTGTAELQLIDPTTNEAVDGRFKNVIPSQFFTIAAGQSQAVNFPIEIPYLYDNSLVWRIVAKAGTFSDGEENVLPVLTNRALVIESMPLNVNGTGTKTFSFEKLLKADSSQTLAHQSLTVEYTSNPAWLAVQALPYLMEYPYDCAEQTWNRYYANSIATNIANSSPKLKAVFDQWASAKDANKEALVSNLLKNEDLKSVIAAETPWLLQGKNESEQRKHIALLFDLSRMSGELNSAFDKLKQMQSENGGFVWFKGGSEDRYMTQYIATGIGHLLKLGAILPKQQGNLESMSRRAIGYLDAQLIKDYQDLLKYKTDLKKYIPDYSIIQYFYMRSFYDEVEVPAKSRVAYDYFLGRLPIAWTTSNKYMQGMIALILHRKGNKTVPEAILKSLKETSVVNEELGRYWKDAGRSWWWYEAPLERQALLVEAFQEIGNDTKTADELRTWLIKNKQTNNWETTKATAEACYALLLQGSNWIAQEPTVQIKLGTMEIKPKAENVEAGTGYFKERIAGADVTSAMGSISVTVANASPAAQSMPSWGAVYWQYFEDLDKITSAATPLTLGKKLFITKNTDRGPQLQPVNEGDVLHVGDKITVRIELKVDRDMEYVHMKDMRAAALEPVNVLSSYKWQGGLGYYESTRNASTNFFFSSLRKGSYVFEYNLFVTNTGNFSNGITTIQCMYAPEFTAHSEGIRIDVE